MGAGTQLGVAGTQIEIFDFGSPEKVLYASWGVALGSPWGRRGVALGSPWCPRHLGGSEITHTQPRASPGDGSIGTTDLTYGGVGVGPGPRLGVVTKLQSNFASAGAPWGRRRVAVGSPWSNVQFGQEIHQLCHK